MVQMDRFKKKPVTIKWCLRPRKGYGMCSEYRRLQPADDVPRQWGVRAEPLSRKFFSSIRKQLVTTADSGNIE